MFIGVSAPKVLTPEMVGRMAADPIIFAMANPEPEIDPNEAKKAGARIDELSGGMKRRQACFGGCWMRGFAKSRTRLK